MKTVIIHNKAPKNSQTSKGMKGVKRDKLKNLLIMKYMKHFGLTEENQILNDEVCNFLDNDKVNDADMKKLEKNLALIFNKKKAMAIGRQNTNQNLVSVATNNNLNTENKREMSLPPIEKKHTFQTNDFDLDDDDLLDDRERRNKKEIAKNGDEWEKIISYNKKQFENEKIQKVQKEVDLKIKTKINLENQIYEKMARNQEEAKESNQYFNYVMKDLDNYHKTEKMKQDEIKRKVMHEKEIRDKQLKEEKVRKRIESKNELEHDRYLLQLQLDKIENEKKAALAKKAKEKEAYNQIQLDNIAFKKTQEEKRQQERESDIKAQEEYSRILDKQEKARADYFKRCENRQNDFMSKMAENVVKVNDDKNAKLDNDIIKYQNERENFQKMEEDRRKKRQADQKVETRKFLDMQIDYKKKENDEDKKLSMKMANWMQTDTKVFEAQEREKNEKVYKII